MKFKPIYLLYLILFIPLFLAKCGNPSSMDWKTMEVSDLQGNPVDMSQYEGKRIVLNFWATWCGPCIAEMPSLEKARRNLQGDDYVFLLVSDEPLDRIKAFKNAKPSYGFEFLKLEQSIKLQGIFSIPQTYVIDRNGQVDHAINGMTDWASKERIEKLKSVQ